MICYNIIYYYIIFRSLHGRAVPRAALLAEVGDHGVGVARLLVEVGRPGEHDHREGALVPHLALRREGHLDENNCLHFLCVSSLRRGHANILCIVPILTDDPRRESTKATLMKARVSEHCSLPRMSACVFMARGSTTLSYHIISYHITSHHIISYHSI
jgi:hypothetical protein